MSELTPPAPIFPKSPRRGAWNLWGTMASAMLHAGALLFLIWQPPPDRADAAPPAAIDVVLVPPPETAEVSEPPAEEPDEEPEETPAEQSEPQAPTPPVPPAGTPTTEPPRAEQSAAPIQSAPARSAPETPAEAAALAAEPEAAATQRSEPEPGSETASAKLAPIPLSRPRVRGLTAPESGPAGAVVAVTADTGEVTEGPAPPAPSAEPDLAALELGAPRSANDFYFEAMLSLPSMARARAALETLPPERRLAQTCILEALAQIGNAGKGFAPDVVMADAYARSEATGTRLAATGAIFRSGDSWYGLAFDCTLSDDLTRVTAFSYRLGADVTEAVLARLNNT